MKRIGRRRGWETLQFLFGSQLNTTMVKMTAQPSSFSSFIIFVGASLSYESLNERPKGDNYNSVGGLLFKRIIALLFPYSSYSSSFFFFFICSTQQSS